MKSIQELEQIRNRMRDQMSRRENNGGYRIVVGMATCGIAAGARPVMKTLIDELKLRNKADVPVTMTGCIGVCRLEPIVEVYAADGTKTTYVKMDENKAKRVVAEHIVNGSVCVDLTIGAAENQTK